MLKRISEVNVYPKFDLRDEYIKIEDLFSTELIASVWFTRLYPEVSVEGFMKIVFLKWHLRGTFINLHEMRRAWGIDKPTMANTAINLTEENVLFFLQYVYNCLYYFTEANNESDDPDPMEPSIEITDYHKLKALVGNADTLLFYLGADKYFDNEKREFVVYYRDVADDIVVEQHADIQTSLKEYKQIGIHNDLQRKGEILTTLYKKFETFRSSLKETEFNKLQSDTGMLLDLARHSPKDPVKARFAAMPDEEKIIWYDKTYKMFIACLSVLPYVEDKPAIERLKK